MPNRLADESSPYLLQHANNPVNWFPWGEEALSLSKQNDRPIFLSVGYSACHWCHVMEHESFENAAIARILNDNFVSIKVDREERPDIDQIYMDAVMAIRGGGGGWPLSAFLTPELDVFFGGTYWPPKSRVGMPGFDQVLLSVLDAFHSRRDQVNEQSKRITEWLSTVEPTKAISIEYELLKNSATALIQHFDFENGGFGTAPKFPHAMDLSFLVQLASDQQLVDKTEATAAELLNVVRINCKKMAYGGIFDHLGGGFARYSVDEKWLVPHFEKMLYDNALLAGLYLDMHRTTEDPFYAMIARKTLDYLVRDMKDPLGGIHSTEDADSEGEEGKFYVWSKQEIDSLLGDDAKLFCDLYNVTSGGNFEGHNILNMTQSYDQFAQRHGMQKSDLREIMRRCRKVLFDTRENRIRPEKDDKVLVSWNGLAISAFSKMAAVDETYLDNAIDSANFIRNHMLDEQGQLLHTHRNGTSKLNGFLDDYSYLINSLIDLYEASFDPQWIVWADSLTCQMLDRFQEKQQGGFYFTPIDHEELISRPRSFQDSSVPSGNAMAATALIRLGRLLDRSDWVEISEKTILAGVPLMNRSPLASGQMLVATSLLLGQHHELVLLVDDFTCPSVNLIRKKRPFNSSLIVVSHRQQLDSSHPLRHAVAGRKQMDDQPTLYVCQNYQCELPIAGQDTINQTLESLARPEGFQP